MKKHSYAPMTQPETANVLYGPNEHMRDLEVLTAETEFIVHQCEIAYQLSDDICVWNNALPHIGGSPHMIDLVQSIVGK